MKYSPPMSMANELFFFLLSLLAIAASAQVFVSIDCGGSSNVYTDEKGIKWSGDDPFIQTGKNAVVQTSNSNSISHVMNTLRVFPTHNKKNCYSINATNGEKFLVRASFYYGNYDNKSSPPSFDLHFNGNKRITVVTSSEELVSKVAIYNVKVDAISVCLAQTHPNQLPFISALEVRSLASTIDVHNNSITVNIPGFLGDLPNLKELNLLADSNFSGSGTPSSHDTLTTPYYLPYDYISPPPPPVPNVSVTVKSRRNPRMSTKIVAPVGSISGFMLIVAIIIYFRHKEKKAKLAAATRTANDVRV